MSDLTQWRPRPRPGRVTRPGTYIRLEPLDPARHASDLYTCSDVPDAEARFRWLFEYPPTDMETFANWVTEAAASNDPMFFAVVDQKTGRTIGRQSLMRIDQAHGVIEIGNIYWGPEAARTPRATEALFLVACYVFDELGYRRFEWKCNDQNTPSKRSAERFGFQFEGVFRQHMVFKGQNRDTAWFAMIDEDWPSLRAAMQSWLDPSNFDADGQQHKPLEEFRR